MTQSANGHKIADDLATVWTGFNDAKSVLQKLEHRMDATENAKKLEDQSYSKLNTTAPRFQNVTFREPSVTYNDSFNPLSVSNQMHLSTPRNQSGFVVRDLRNIDDTLVRVPVEKSMKHENDIDDIINENRTLHESPKGSVIPPRVLNECTNDIYTRTTNKAKSPARNLASAGVARLATTTNNMNTNQVYKFLHKEKQQGPNMASITKSPLLLKPEHAPYKRINLEKQRKRIEQDPNSLARLKMKIEMQKMGRSPTSVSSSFSNSQSTREAEPVVLIDRKAERQCVRKTAQGPSAPKYKGFSAAETRIKTPDGKIWKAGDKSNVRSTSARPNKSKVATSLFKPTNENNRSKSASVTSGRLRPLNHDTSKNKPKTVVRKTGKIDFGDRKNLITPSSWREGQRLAESILGPPPKQAKSIAPPNSPPTRDVEKAPPPHRPMKSDGGKAFQNDQSSKSSDSTPGPAKKAKIKPSEIHTETLSAGVKTVLRDLHLSSSESEPEDGDKGPQTEVKSMPKVKVAKGRGRSLERKPGPVVKKEPEVVAKNRHYKQEEVQKYIARQKADRKRRNQEMKHAQKEADNKKQQQLEELYKKQKEAFHRKNEGATPNRTQSGASVSSPHKALTMTSHALPAKYQDKIAALMGRIEEYENQSTVSTKPVSSSNRDTTPKKHDVFGSPRPQYSMHYGSMHTSHAPSHHVQSSVTTSPQMRNMTSDITSEFVQKLDKYLKDDVVPRSTVDQKGHDLGLSPGQRERDRSFDRGNYTNDGNNLSRTVIPDVKFVDLTTSFRNTSVRSHLSDSFTVKEPIRTRAERLAALREQVDSLQDKLASQSNALLDPGFKAMVPSPEKLQEILENNPPRGVPRSAWAIKDDGIDVPDFARVLPGVTNLEGHSSKVKEDNAAVKIQSAYRGHRVRQAMRTWELPSGRTMHDVITGKSHRKQDSLRDVLDGGNEEAPTSSRSHASETPIKLRSVDEILRDLGKTEFCAQTNAIGQKKAWEEHLESKDQSEDKFFNDLESELKTRQEAKVDSLLADNDVPPWERTGGDKYSVVNIFTKRYLKNLQKEPTQPENIAMKSAESSISYPKHDSLKLKLRDDSDSSKSMSLRSNASPRSARSLPEDNAMLSPKTYSSRSAESSRSYSAKSLEKTPVFNHDLSNSVSSSIASKSHKKEAHKEIQTNIPALADSLMSSDDEAVGGTKVGGAKPASSIGADINAKLFLKLGNDDGQKSGFGVPVEKRFSPAALELKMAAELNYHESVEESLRHLSGVEKAQNVSLAQQETVSLAQVLKARQLQHQVEMERLTMKAKEEAIEAERAQLKERRENDKEVAMTTKQIQDSTINALNAQEKAARMTAHAADKIASALNRERDHHSTVTSYSSESSRSTDSRSTVTSETYKDDVSPQSSPRALDLGTKQGGSKPSPPSVMSEHSTTSVRMSDESIPEQVALKSSSESSKTIEEDIPDLTNEQSASEAATISEELSFNKAKSTVKPRKHDVSDSDYSMKFDESLTESEMEEISRRALVPSESHRRNQRRHASPHATFDRSDVSISSDDHSVRRKLQTTSLFENTAEDSDYSAFMSGIVREYVLQDEMRSKHQAAMLKLREKALKEKTKAELQFVEQQKRLLRNKGEDDKMPPLQKKKRHIIRRWHAKSDEIKRMKALQTAAEQNRKMLLQQDKEIGRIRQSTHHIKEKLKGKDETTPRTKKQPDEGHITSSTPVAELSNTLDDVNGSNSEVEVSSSSSSSVMKTLKSRFAGGMDERKLTKREQRLQQRRKHAEQLLKWKQKLDEEEQNIISLERHVQSLDKKAAEATSNDEAPPSGQPSNSESSIAEEIPSSGSASPPINERKIDTTKSPESSDATVTDDRSIESTAKEDVTLSVVEVNPAINQTEKTKTKSTRSESAPKSPESVTPLLPSPGRPTTSQTTPPVVNVPIRGRKESLESWSDESFSQTQSETEHSDIECRVRALKEELNRRKSVAERLKKQQKRREKERLRAQEASLRNQLETLDSFIRQTQNEINKELDGSASHSNDSGNHAIASKPQIRSPRKTDQSRQAARALRSSGTVSPEGSPRSGSHRHVPAITKARTESESSGKSSRSLSFEDDNDKTLDEWPLNGAKALVEALPSRRSPQEASKSTQGDKSERPKKLDLPSQKSTNGTSNVMSPIIVEKISKIPQLVKTPPQDGTIEQKPTKETESPPSRSESLKSTELPKPKESSKPPEMRKSGIPVAKNSISPVQSVKSQKSLNQSSVASESAGYSEDFESLGSSKKDEEDQSTLTSIKSDDDISERLSEYLSDHNDSSSALFDVNTGSKKKEDLSFLEELSDTKTPVPSPLTTPRSKTGDSIKEELDAVVTEEDNVSSSFNSDLGKAISEASKNFESFASEVIDEPEQEKSTATHHRLAEELSEKLLKSLLEDTVTNTLDLKKDNDESEIKEESKEEEEELSKSSKNLLELLSESPEQTLKQKEEANDEQQKLTDTFTNDLLQETISKVLEVRKERNAKLSQEDEPEQKSPQRDFENGREVADILTQDLPETNEAESSEREPSVVRPVSPIFGTGANQDEVSEEWIDDDFGISSFHKQKPIAVEKDLAMANDKWREGHVIEVVSNRYEAAVPSKHYVPHEPTHILRLIDSAVSVVYGLQMKGNLSMDIPPPDGVFDDVSSESDSENSDEDDSTKLEERKVLKSTFKNSLFDLVKEIVCEIYAAQETPVDVPLWQKSNRKPRPSYCRKSPTNQAELCATVRNQVSKLMNLDGETYKLDPKLTMKWGAKKKKDKVDLILIQELREEEPDWTNYDEDETSVKIQLADTVLDMLLSDTIQCLQNIEKSKAENIETEQDERSQ